MGVQTRALEGIYEAEYFTRDTDKIVGEQPKYVYRLSECFVEVHIGTELQYTSYHNIRNIV